MQTAWPLKVEALWSFKVLVTAYSVMHHHIPEHLNPHQHHSENLTSLSSWSALMAFVYFVERKDLLCQLLVALRGEKFIALWTSYASKVGLLNEECFKKTVHISGVRERSGHKLFWNLRSVSLSEFYCVCVCPLYITPFIWVSEWQWVRSKIVINAWQLPVI